MVRAALTLPDRFAKVMPLHLTRLKLLRLTNQETTARQIRCFPVQVA
jgi:hypothetical protein